MVRARTSATSRSSMSPHKVPVAVVDLLEEIEVDDHHGRDTPVAFGRGERFGGQLGPASLGDQAGTAVAAAALAGGNQAVDHDSRTEQYSGCQWNGVGDDQHHSQPQGDLPEHLAVAEKSGAHLWRGPQRS